MRQEVKTREIRKYPTAIMVIDLMTREDVPLLTLESKTRRLGKAQLEKGHLRQGLPEQRPRVVGSDAY